MTRTKASSRLLAGGAGSGRTAKEKTEATRGDKPAKPVRRVVPKPLRVRLLGNAESTVIPPPAILWDDPVDPATGAKLKR
jgi:hypothetical protein